MDNNKSKQIQRNINLDRLTMKIIIKNSKIDDKAREKLTNLLGDIVSSEKNSAKQKKLNEKFSKELASIDFHNTYLKSYEITDELKNMPYLNLTEEEEQYIEGKISTSAGVTLKKLSDDIMKNYATLDLQKEVTSKENKDKPINDQPENDFGINVNEEEKKPISKEKQMILENKAQDLITSKINNSVTILTPNERKLIKDAYPDLGELSDEYYNMATLEMAMKIKKASDNFDKYNHLNIFSKKAAKLSILDLYQMANNISIVAPNELLREEIDPAAKSKMDALFSKTDILASVDNYTKAYNTYTNYFNHLSSDEQNKEKVSLMTPARQYPNNYFNITEFQIYSPTNLKNNINKQVTDKMLSKAPEFLNEDPGIPAKINYATKYMNVEQISTLYRLIKNRVNEFDEVRSDMPEKVQREKIRNQSSRTAILQQNFAKAIIMKTQNKALTPEEIEALSVKICKENFKEEPKFKVVFDKTHQVNPEEPNQETKKTQDKYFGMSKLQIAMAKIKGTWKNYDQTIEQEKQNDEQEKTMDDNDFRM